MSAVFKRYIALILIFIGIGLLWNTLFVYPLKIFVVFMHEVSHGLAAIATGGRIVEIQINPQQGGHALTQGGSRFWTLTAGYLGSLLWGGLILLLAARTHLDKGISILIGFGMVAISIAFGESAFTYLFVAISIAFGETQCLHLSVRHRLRCRTNRRWVLSSRGYQRLGTTYYRHDKLPLRNPRHQKRCLR